MDYLEKLKSGKSLKAVFSSVRETPYRYLFIVSAKGKDTLLNYSEDISLISEWYDRIDDFDNFIFTKVYLSDKYNYVYSTGKLISPYWSNEMERMGQHLWPIVYNGRYNFIKEGALLFKDAFADGVWTDEENPGSFIIKEKSSSLYSQYDCFYRVTAEGEKVLLGSNSPYKNKPVEDLYLSEMKLTESLTLQKRFSLFSVLDSSGKAIAKDFTKIITYRDRPISVSSGLSEGILGSLFIVRKETISGQELLFLSCFFATIQSPDGYHILCFSSELLLPDTYEDVQVLKYPYIKVRKNNVWNIVDKYGDYLSKDLWFDNIELLYTGNAIVSMDGRLNFVKSNGNLFSPEWYDEITTSTEAGKFILRKGEQYNIIDCNLQLMRRAWFDSKDELPLKEETDLSSSWYPIHKTMKSIKAFDSIWLKDTDKRITEFFLLNLGTNSLSVIQPTRDNSYTIRSIAVYGYSPDADYCRTPIGTFYFNKPAEDTNV